MGHIRGNDIVTGLACLEDGVSSRINFNTVLMVKAVNKILIGYY